MSYIPVSSRALSGGRPPTSHRGELARATAWFAFARRESAWIGGFVGLHPELRDGSLYGDCLKELAANVDVSSESEARPRCRPRFARRAPDAPLDSRRPTQHERASSPLQAASVRFLSKPNRNSPVRREEAVPKVAPVLPPVSRRANLDLLHRLTGGTSPADSSAPNHQTVEDSQLRNAEVSPSISRDPQSVGRWLRELAKHAGRRLFRHGSVRLDPVRADRPDPAAPAANRFLSDQWLLSLSGQVEAENSPNRNAEASPPILQEPQSIRQRLLDPAEITGRRLSSHGSVRLDPVHGAGPDSAAPANYRFLSDQWSMSLTGQAAPVDLLARLAGHSLNALYSHPGTAAKTSQTFSPLAHSEDGPSIARSFDPEDEIAKRKGTAMEGDLSAAPDDLSRSSAQSGASFPRMEAPPDREFVLKSEFTSAQTAQTSAMPSLLPNFISGDGNASAAGAMIRRGVIAEHFTGQEDGLSDLSAKISWILAEEARRHGIDV
jgi:hypothetical protein